MRSTILFFPSNLVSLKSLLVTELPDDMQYVNNLVSSLFVSSINWSAIKFVLSDVHIHPFADAESFIQRISKSAFKIITSEDSWFISDV